MMLLAQVWCRDDLLVSVTDTIEPIDPL